MFNNDFFKLNIRKFYVSGNRKDTAQNSGLSDTSAVRTITA